MQIIPLTATPNQQLSVVLAQQNCQISVYQKSTGLYLDLTVNNVPVVTTRLCLNGVPMVIQPYLGFVGELIFLDDQGANDPDYTGLGSRFFLVYLEVSDL